LKRGLSSHFPLDHVDSSEISSTRFYIWQKSGCGVRNFSPFKTKKLEMLVVETLPKLFMRAKFYWPIDF